MLSSDRIRTKLRAALDSCDQKSLKAIISQLPTALPHAEDPLEIATCLEQVRVAADVFIEACDSDTAFESAIRTRSALISARVLPWAVSVLKNFAFEERVISRVALTLAHLGGGVESRGDIGAAGAVDELSSLWKSHPSCSAIVQTLISLCGGHIDNISRFMRRRGITTAIKVLKSSDAARNTLLAERILILMGICAICTPDNNFEGISLVPTILGVLKVQKTRTQTHLTRHSFIAIANMAECWKKEKAGYKLGDLHVLTELILEKWISSPRSGEMAFASSWALTALYGYDESVLNRIKGRSKAVEPILERWRVKLRTVDHLASLTEEIQPEMDFGQKRSDSIDKPIEAKTGKTVIPDPGSEVDGIDSESEGSDTQEGSITDRENSPVSVDQRSIESQTIVSDSDSDDDGNLGSELADETKPKTNYKKSNSPSKEIPIVILDSDSDGQCCSLAEPRYPSRSKKGRSSPKTMETTRTRKRPRAKRSDQDSNITLTQVSAKKRKEELGPENPGVRRSSRQRKPTPKFSQFRSSPGRQRTRLLGRTSIESELPRVLDPSIVPPNCRYTLC